MATSSPKTSPPIGTDEDYRIIEKSAGITTPNAQLREKLAKFFTLWPRNSDRDLAHARQAAVHQAIQRLKTKAEPLLQQLGYPSYKGDDLSKAARALAYGDALDWLGVSKELAEHLQRLVDQANNVSDAKLTDKGGRPRDTVFQMMLDSLVDIYEGSTGHKAGISYHGKYQGRYFRFVKECITRFAPQLSREDDALGKAIQRHLKERRSRLGMDKT